VWKGKNGGKPLIVANDKTHEGGLEAGNFPNSVHIDKEETEIHKKELRAKDEFPSKKGKGGGVMKDGGQCSDLTILSLCWGSREVFRQE